MEKFWHAGLCHRKERHGRSVGTPGLLDPPRVSTRACNWVAAKPDDLQGSERNPFLVSETGVISSAACLVSRLIWRSLWSRPSPYSFRLRLLPSAFPLSALAQPGVPCALLCAGSLDASFPSPCLCPAYRLHRAHLARTFSTVRWGTHTRKHNDHMVDCPTFRWSDCSIRVLV
jgi:hypothetical protein